MNVQMLANENVNHRMDVEKIGHNDHLSTDTRVRGENIGYSLDITGKSVDKASYGKKELKSIDDIALTASLTNVEVERNYSAVMSNSMSHEDYAELTKDGVHPAKMTVKESVTNLDKIKIKMAEAGMTIEGYNDDLSKEDIEAAGYGNVGEARIKDALNKANLPDTKENIEAVSEVLGQVKQLEPLSDDAVKYMINNNEEPTIENIYKAEHSSRADYRMNSDHMSYKGAVTLANADMSMDNWDKLRPQVEKIIEESDLEDMDKGLEDAKWMLKNELPVTGDNLELYERITSVSLPMSEDKAIEAITNAITDGIEPEKANLSESENLYQKAVRLKDYFDRLDDKGDITRRRQLEEVRLAMTTEANLTLLRKGISIETEPLEKLVEELKEAEREFYRPLLIDEKASLTDGIDNVMDEKSNNADVMPQMLNIGQNDELDARIDLYKASVALYSQIESIPVKTVADITFDADAELTATNLSVRGAQNKSLYEKAGQSYESLMTAPRADMGDSLRKAFNNVDDILEDLDFELNDTNRKAVRTLGYSEVAINRENIERIREATDAVNRVVSLMTPARTLKLIKDGYNPINDDIYELERKLGQEEAGQSNDRYSKFLYELEKRSEITEEEKSAYIGMYRLLNQIEKQDGRVISNVLFNGQDLTMANMLKASRSNRHRNMDVRVDDDFGALEELVKKTETITDQLDKVFNQLVSEEASKEYIEENMRDIRRAVKASDSVEKLLDDIDEPVTIENILAVSDMMPSGPKAIRKLFNANSNNDDRQPSNVRISNEAALDRVDDGQAASDFLREENVKELVDNFTDRDSAEEAYENFIEKAIEIAEKRIENADKYIDVKDLSMLTKQLSLGKSLARKEAYDIPVRTKDGITSLHLSIEHGDDDGKVNASLETDEYGRVNASFRLTTDGVDGFIVTDSRLGEENLKSLMPQLEEAFSQIGNKTKNLSIVFSVKSQEAQFISADNTVKTSNSGLYRIAKAFIETIV